MNLQNRTIQLVFSLTMFLLVAGCASNMPRLDDAPADTYATPVGFRGIRYWGDVELKKLNEVTALRMQQIAEASRTIPSCRSSTRTISRSPAAEAMAPSARACWSAGANSAPDLNSRSSPGSAREHLMAPFAFLGTESEPQLTKIYTTISTKDIMRSNGPVGAIFGSSLTDNSPLKALVATYVHARTARPDRDRERARTQAADRDHQSRRAEARGVGHDGDRRQRKSRQTATLPRRARGERRHTRRASRPSSSRSWPTARPTTSCTSTAARRPRLFCSPPGIP